jgi:cysteine-rich repeat protein
MRCERALAAALALAASAGCDVFDPALYMNAAGDAGPLTELPTQDVCSGTAPSIAPQTEMLDLDTSALSNDVWQLATCTGYDAPGNDAFFSITAERGQKFHFHVRAVDTDRNPVVYVLPRSCDERSCQPGDAIDECGAGSDEHLSFTAGTAGQYVVGIDDRVAGGAAYRVLVAAPVCGNGGDPEHSETCDDGNTTGGDGCDAMCRVEIGAAAPTEDEPNDDWTSANIVVPGATGALTVSGRIGGRCDFDTYGLEVPAGGSLRATLMDASGAACPATAGAMTLTLIRPDGRTTAGVVSTPSPCPAIDATHTFAQSLDEGQWYVRVSAAADAAVFDYEIRLEIL